MKSQNAINNIEVNEISSQTFTTSGTYTPTSGMRYCIVKIVGAGGAGGGSLATGATSCSAGSGGGAGGYAEVLLTADQIGASQTVTIGASGVGVLGANGGAGGTSSLGSLITCNGGTGGNAGILNTTDDGFVFPGNGGSVTIATGEIIISVNGQNGQFAAYSGASNYAYGQTGGSTPFGSSCCPYITFGGFFDPPNSLDYGTGGSGGASTNNRNAEAGGNGGSGYVSILEFISKE